LRTLRSGRNGQWDRVRSGHNCPPSYGLLLRFSPWRFPFSLRRDPARRHRRPEGSATGDGATQRRCPLEGPRVHHPLRVRTILGVKRGYNQVGLRLSVRQAQTKELRQILGKLQTATILRSCLTKGRDVAPLFSPAPGACIVDNDTGEQRQQQHATCHDKAHAHSPNIEKVFPCRSNPSQIRPERCPCRARHSPALAHPMMMTRRPVPAVRAAPWQSPQCRHDQMPLQRQSQQRRNAP
jgi:hypothetical protein